MKTAREIIADQFREFLHQEGARQRSEDFADGLLARIKDAGLTIHDDTEAELQYAVQWTLSDGTSTSSPYYRREHAEHRVYEAGHLRDRGQVVQRIAWVEPWRAVEASEERS